MPKQIIAVDLDDVLSYTAEGWLAYSNKTWNTNLNISDYDEDWLKVWDIQLPEALQRRKRLFESGVYSRYEHIKEAHPVLERLAGTYRLVVLTSRVAAVQDSTFSWLEMYFKGIFDAVSFTGIYDNQKHESVRLTKADHLKEISASYLIGDQPKHCIAAAERGIQALMVGDYTWNQISILPDGVVRVHDWLAVARYFNVES